MAEYTSGAITFTGLGNGTDFDSLIEGLLEVEHTQINRLEKWKASWELKTEMFQELNSKLVSFRSTLTSMDTMNEFLVKNVASSDSTAISATADADAFEGTHTVEVHQLAQNKIMVNQTGFAETDDEINSSGSSQIFAYTYQGETRTLTIQDGTTLDGLKAIINNDAYNPGVRAAIVNDGTNSYLQIRGMDLGVDADLVIDGSTTLTGFSAADFDTTQENQNSQITVDGWPATGFISNASNTVEGVVEGLTLNLKEAAPGSTLTLTVDTDMEAVKENVRTFVTQMNEIRSMIKELTAFDESKKAGSILTGNYGVEIVSQNLKNMVANKAVGFDYFTVNGSATTGDLFSALSQVGITTIADTGAGQGLLMLDEERLEEVLDRDITAVAQLFAADYIGESNSNDFSYYSHIDSLTKAGTYDVKVVTDGSGISQAWINGQEAAVDGWLITAPGGSDASGLVIRVDNHTLNSTFTGTVDMKLGKFGEMAEHIKELSSDDGPLKILQENYDDIMDNIDRKIESEEARLVRYERNLRNKYSRLDTTLGAYENIQASMASAIAQLDQ